MNRDKIAKSVGGVIFWQDKKQKICHFMVQIHEVAENNINEIQIKLKKK
jgi:hypothetical protein